MKEESSKTNRFSWFSPSISSKTPTPMANKEEQIAQRFVFEINSPSLGLLAIAGCICGVSLIIIGFKLGPITKQAKLWNGCVDTTSNFLSKLPSFASNDMQDIKAMAINLCNGSTPQNPGEEINN